MNTLRPEDIYCDNTFSTKKTSTTKITGTSGLPTKPRKKLSRKCLHSKLMIRRSLFGPVDHENTENFLKKELDILSDLSNKKWNFDFCKEKPLDGQWLWESVGPNDPSVPSAYRGTFREDQPAKCDEVQRSCPETTTPLALSVDHANVNVVSRNNNSTLLTESSCVRSSKPRDAKRKALQPTIKGFLTVKKAKPMKHHNSVEKTKLSGLKDNTTPTFLHIIKSVSPTKSLAFEDNIAL